MQSSMIRIYETHCEYVYRDFFGHLFRCPYKFTKHDLIALYLELKEYRDSQLFGFWYVGRIGQVNYKVLCRKSCKWYISEIRSICKDICNSDSVYFLVNFKFNTDICHSLIQSVSIRK